MGKRTAACVVAVVSVAGSVMLLRWLRKKQVKHLEEKSGNPPHRLVGFCASVDEIIGIDEEEMQMPSASCGKMEEEELLTVDLWLLLNRLDTGKIEKPSIIKQEIVVIDNHDLQIANRCKYGYSNSSSNPSYFKVEPKFFPVEPSMEGYYFRTVSVGSYIYLIGGWEHVSLPYCRYLAFDTKNTYRIDANNVFFERTKEQPHLHKLSPLQKNSRTYPSVVTNGKRIYAFGGLEACEDSGDDVEKRLVVGERYDIEKDFWFSFDALPFEDAAQWTTKGCIMWDSEEMTVLFLQKNIEEEEEGEGEGEEEEVGEAEEDLLGRQ